MVLTYSLKIATVLSSESTRATLLDSPIRCFCKSSMASTIGTDILTTDPSSRRRELKWRVWRNSDCFMNPWSGLAHPSLNTWTHCKSIFVNLILGNEIASLRLTSFWDLSTNSSTSLPPSGSIKPARIRATLFGWSLGVKESLRGRTKWVLEDLEREAGVKGALVTRLLMEAIDGILERTRGGLSSCWLWRGRLAGRRIGV